MTSQQYEKKLLLRQALPWLLFITSIFFFNFISRVIYSPFMVSIEADMGISHSQAGRFFLYVSLGYSLGLLFSGYISSRIHHRWCIVLASLWMGLCLLALSQAGSLLLTQVLLFACGIAGGVYLPSGIAAMTSLVHAKDIGKAISVHELAPNLGFILAPILAEFFLVIGTWRTGLAWLGVGAIVLGVIYAFFGRGGEFHGQAPNLGILKSFGRQRVFWILSGLFFMGVGASLGPYSVLPLFLVDERGFTPEQANHLLSLSRLLGPAAVLVAGVVVDRLGPKPTLSVYLVMVAVTTMLLGLLRGPWLVAAVLIQPLFSVCFFTPAFAAIARIYPSRLNSMAVSLIVPFGLAGGGGLVPAFLGFLGDSGGFGLGFALFGGVLGLYTLILPFLKVPDNAE